MNFAARHWIFTIFFVMLALSPTAHSALTPADVKVLEEDKAQAEKGAAGAQPEGGEPKSEEKKDEGVIDAEVVDEKK
jgi:hypothetical protein